MRKGISGLNSHQKRFIDCFKQITYKQQSWQVWSDFIYMSACAISNRFDKERFEEREKHYLDRIGRYDAKEQRLFPELFASVVDALDADHEQDFLGNLFMQLELSNHWKGQFFTPYPLCRLMADMQFGEIDNQISRKGYISVNDPACGAGATLIGFANAVKDKGINYQDHVLFVAQDIDQTAALMCYIQLSLLGCPGYVVIGDTLSSPITEDLRDHDVWYTPLYFSVAWHYRRIFKTMDKMIGGGRKEINGKPKIEAIKPIKAAQKAKQDEQPLQLTLF